MPGLELPGVFLLRELSDGAAIKRHIEQENPASAVIIGGGYIGMEMADVLRGRGLAVTVLERLEQLRDSGKLVEAQRLEQRTKYDVEMIRELGYCQGIENYSRYLSGREPGDFVGSTPTSITGPVVQRQRRLRDMQESDGSSPSGITQNRKTVCRCFGSTPAW